MFTSASPRRLVHVGQPKTLHGWSHDGRIVYAATRNEARPQLKKTIGGTLPVGAAIRKWR